MSVMIKSENLEVHITPPPSSAPYNQRFDSAAVVESVILNGKHSFCVPEQRMPERRTCGGTGLCGEFVWNDLGREVRVGQKFPKPGVGLLTQSHDHSPFDMWGSYRVEPFETRMTLHNNRAVFVQEPNICLGIGMRIHRELLVWKNTLTLYTTLENTGLRPLDMMEYQHNFVAVDDIPAGPGYRLRVPFDGDIDRISGCCFPRSGREPVPDALYAVGDTIHWNRSMSFLEFHKGTDFQEVLPMAHYFWTLSHEASPASIEESVSFAPCRLGLWGIEHCICPEVFVKIDVSPGERQSWSRTWIFRDDITGD